MVIYGIFDKVTGKRYNNLNRKDKNE